MAKKAPPKKITVTDMLNDVSPYELEGTLQQLSEQVQTWITQYGPTARFNWDPDYWPQYNDSPSPRYEIKIDREETDGEQAIRLEKEAIAKSAQENRERKEFERLQKKFGAK